MKDFVKIEINNKLYMGTVEEYNDMMTRKKILQEWWTRLDKNFDKMIGVKNETKNNNDEESSII